MIRTLLAAALPFALVLLAPSACSTERAQPQAPATSDSPATTAERPKEDGPAVTIGSHRFRVEIARTPQERARGLMFREQMDEDVGMLFLFDRMQKHSFWMKNTKIPLDMLFIDDAGHIVGIVENAEPMTLSSRSVSLPSQYVLELNGGTCRRLGIKADTKAQFIGVPGHPVRSAGAAR